jgi:hypothetical protein
LLFNHLNLLPFTFCLDSQLLFLHGR